MSKELKDRLARGELTNTKDYRRMKDTLREEKNTPTIKDTSDSQEWKNWELSPVWSPSDDKKTKPVENSIRADSVQRALDRMDKV